VSDPVQIERRPVDHGVIVVLRMHRPEARNAMNTAMLIALLDALDEAARDDEVAGLLLAGSPDVFSAGADVREDLADDGRRRMELFTEFYEQLTLFRMPTAAAVAGPAVGGGAEAAIACDLRVAEPSALFRFPGAIYGIPVGTSRTISQVGLGVAKDWVFSGRDVTAEEAHERGLVQRLVADGTAEATAMEWLALTASRDRTTVQLLKRLFNDGSGLRDRVMFENDALRAQTEAGTLPPGLDVDVPRTIRPRLR
jgi:enoyl-CoA hydratase/carnithine racemase